MRRRWLSMIIGLWGCSSVLAASPSASALLAERLNAFHTYQAHFAQTSLSPQGRVLDQSHGVVSMERPGRFRWETAMPTHQVLVMNAQQLWIYDVDLEQVTEEKLSGDTSINPAALLNGSIKDLTKNFNIESSANTPDTFLLKPKQANHNFHSIEVRFKSGRLVGMKVVNTLDEVSLFEFTKVKVNSRLQSDLFNFKAPEGVDVVRQ